jgi:phosphoribosylglycinamide formyltransferase-1
VAEPRLPRIAILASHEGSVLQAVLDATQDNSLDARVNVVISNNSNSGALRRARNASVPTAHLSGKTHPRPADLDLAIANLLRDQQTNLVLLAGYMKRLGPITLDAFAGHIINTHPSLLPRYGGLGLYGLRVHEAVLASGDAETGATVHIVETDYDSGPILAQTRIDVRPDDTAQRLERRVKCCERELLLNTLRTLVTEQQKYIE